MSRRRWSPTQKPVEVLGEAELRRKLLAMPDEVRKAVSREIADGAMAVRSEAISRAPVGGEYVGQKARRRSTLGTLRQSIRAEMDKDRLGATVGSNLFYALFQELGTRGWRGGGRSKTRKLAGAALKGHAAQPFLFPAMEQEGPSILAKIKESVRRAVEGK
jgi:HK97 gp10 family phage protein